MGQVKDIACSVWRRLKGAAASLCSAVTGPARGAHSAHGGPSAPDPVPAPAPRVRGTRPARARSSRGAHTASSRRRRVIAARGAHSAPRAPRPSVPVNLNTAPAAARGYSMAEVLATVAIILILGSLVVMNVVALQANLRQKELDSKAEIIYVAAQEQMTRIMASGRESVLAAPNKDNIPPNTPFTTPGEGDICSAVTTTGVAYIPSPNALPGDNSDENPIAPWQTCYISSTD
ncbi:MAG: type II secretion system protein, partial [Coriobacteriales bacterium]